MSGPSFDDQQRGPEDAQGEGLSGDAGALGGAEVEREEAAPAGRAASAQLRESSGEDHAALMDPANQSLAEALRITFRLLMVGMVVLAVFFLFSGVTRVPEGQRGIELRFGRVVAGDVSPGLRFAMPFPIGELVRVSKGQVPVQLDASFAPRGAAGTPVDRWPLGSSLAPGQDGYHVTADLNIAHSQWAATYVRDDHESFAARITPEHADRIVEAALERAIVRAVAETPIDDLLKASPGDADSLARRARALAQAQLDAIGSGIRLETLNLRTRVPPRATAGEFAAVQAATSQAAEERERAIEHRNTTLSNVAGTAAEALTQMISEYERLLALGESEEAAETLSRIHAVLDGKSLAGVPPVSGEVTEIMNRAEAERSRTVQRARADLATFQAALAGYRENPELLIARTWGSALSDLLREDWVEKMVIPPGGELYLAINRDPEIERQQIIRRQSEEVQDTMRERFEELRRNRGSSRGEPASRSSATVR